MAFRFYCSAEVSALCERGNSKPQRTKCRRCGSRLVISEGAWGAFEWTGTGRYPTEAAVRTFAHYKAANRWASERELVARFIPA